MTEKQLEAEVKTGFNLCCAKHIRSIWVENPPENIIERVTSCPECNHFIGITNSTREYANEFLKQFNLEEI